MKPEYEDQADRAELEASLKRLDIRELEERMEVSPLLMVAGENPVEPVKPGLCCVCKIPNPFGPGGNLPYPTSDPTPMGPMFSTGPTNPGMPR
jgi:hypothetical protein